MRNAILLSMFLVAAVARPAALPVISDKDKCGRLKTGQSELVTFMDDEQSPTGTSAIYKLSRPAEDLYVVELNTYYQKGKGYDAPWPEGDIDGHYRELVSACLKQLSPSLKGPGGKRLEIRLSRSAEIPEREISITKKGARSNRFVYESDIGCAVVLHESLHLLGFNDEYPDDTLEDIIPPDIAAAAIERKMPLNLDCRPTAPRDSIMYHHDVAVERSTGGTTLLVEECVCPPSLDCRELAAKADGKNCPPGTAWRKGQYELKSDGSKVEKVALREYFVLATGSAEAVAERQPEKETLLYPAHFRALTEPGCYDVNADFYACTANAYRSSFVLPVKFGLAIHPFKGCLPKPKACEGKSVRWLD